MTKNESIKSITNHAGLDPFPSREQLHILFMPIFANAKDISSRLSTPSSAHFSHPVRNGLNNIVSFRHRQKANQIRLDCSFSY